MTQRPATGTWPTAAGEGPAEWPVIPGYEMVEELGRGGMGVVFKAWQANPKRLVALKLLRDGALASPQERARFRIEAEVAARMRHANIVPIYQVGEHQGRAYLAMEFVDGGSLDHQLAGQLQPASLAAELIRMLALAIQHAHGQQVVHRDLKPANILLASPGGRGGHAPLTDCMPKITDFGLAKRLDSNSTAWTQDGAVLGTASYMAPEQAAGQVREIGPAVDVYALGAILYEMLAGRPPFVGDSWNQTVEQVLHEEPVPPTRLRPDVPRELETVCLTCLEKAPGRRYASALALAEDLTRFLGGKPVAAVPLAARERLARLAARDGFQLREEIGRGPRSTTYRALSGPLAQPVAIKVYADGIWTREKWTAHFQHGAELWAALAHPNLVSVQRAGWWDGAPYVAAEYVPHGDLAARAAGRPYPIVQALQMAEQLTEIVSFLHRQGVIHGNLKPSNVLLAADGIPRLLDLRRTGGLFHGPLPSDDAAPAGLGYLAPELIPDPSAELRPHTDIYGLGIILYELLTGRPAFAGATARQILEQVRSREPLPPSHFNAEVTPSLDRFCLRCLRKNPWRRYHRAYDVLTRLRAFQDHAAGRPLGRLR